MDFDPVLLARLQFAFTITFHIIFPSFTIGLSAFIATLLVLWLRTGREHRYQRLARFWTKIFAVSFAMGVVSGIVLSLPVRHQLEPLLGRRRQRGRPADRLRGADRLLPRSDVPRRPAVRLEPRAALAARAVGRSSSPSAPRSRRSGSWRPTAGCRRRPATRCATASPIRSTGSPIIFNPSFPYRLAHMLTAAYLTTALRRAGGRRALSRWPAAIVEEGRTMMRMAIGMLAMLGAAAAFHRRPARPQHAQAPADQDRRDGGALGRQQARATSLFAWPDEKAETNRFEIVDPARRLAHPHP